MRQVDIETLFRAGSGRRVVCETLIKEPTLDNNPAESFRVPVEDEIDWVDRNAVLRRDGSTKGGPIVPNRNPNSNSKRFKSKASVIGLPKRPYSSQLRASCHGLSCRQPSVRFFSSKPALVEPQSPKVSCIGRIRSIKAKEGGKLGFWARFVAVFGCHQRQKKISGGRSVSEPVSDKGSSKKKILSSRTGGIPSGDLPAELPSPGLGGMKKFTSGRRGESWVNLETGVHVA